MRKRGTKIIAILLTIMLMMIGCGTNENVEGKGSTYNAGTYTAVSLGKVGDIRVEVTFSEDSIEKVEVLEHNETPGISDAAIENIPVEIVKNQTLVVDSVSGATLTSDAIVKAVEECVVQAGGNLEILKVEDEEQVKKSEELEADIIVVGSGISGMSTAISALQNGASVIVVEKQASLGTSFLSSRGNVMMGQVKENKEYHKTESDDTLEKALERWEEKTNEGGKEGLAYPDYDRVEDIIVESGETIAWLEDVGVPFEPSFTKEQRGADVVKVTPEGDETGGTRMIETFISKLEEYGATVLSSTEATELIEKDGKVVGVKATSKDKEYEIKANSVVLATGGFGGSEDYLKELIPDIVETGYQFTGNGVNTGDGITMGKEIGADTYEDGWIIPSPGKILPSKELTSKNSEFNKLNGLSSLEGGSTNQLMLVNKDGNRMTNEAGEGVKIVADLIDNKQGSYYVLFDSSSEEVVSILETGLDTGDILKADSVEELAELSNMSNLIDTFNNYQQMAINGEDTEFNKPAEMLKEYSAQGPYYLVKFVPDFVATMGGLKTNGECQVIRADETPIDGLYAVGELTHRFLYNRAHFANASNSASLTMGRKVGKLLAEKSLQN